MSDAGGGGLRQIFASFGIQFDDSKLKAGAQAVGGMLSRVRELGSAISGNAVVQGIRQFADEFEQTAGRLQDTSDQLGVTTDQLQEMQFVATAAGISAEQSGAMFTRFQQNIGAAAHGGGAAAGAFRALGVHVKDAGGHARGASDLFDETMVALSRISDPAERARRATELYGHAGARMATVAGQGAEAVARLRAEFHQNGGGISPEAAAAANAYGDAMDRNAVAMTSLRSIAATALMPVLTWLVTKVTAGMAAFANLARGTNLAKIGMVALAAAAVVAGAQALIAWLPVIGPILLAAAAVAALGLIVDDLIVMFQGGHSAIGRLLDRLFGVGTATRVVTALKAAWETVKTAVSDAITGLSDFGTAIGDAVADAVAWLTDLWASIQSGWATAGRAVDAVVETVRVLWRHLQPIRDFVVGLATAFIQFHVDAINAVLGLVTDIWTALAPVREFIVSHATGFVQFHVDAINAVLGLVNDIQAAFGRAWQWVSDEFGRIWGAISGRVTGLLSTVTGLFGRIADATPLPAVVADARTAVAEIRTAWSGVDGSRPAGATAQRPTVLTAAASGAGQTQVLTRNTHNQIEIHGATDARQVAAEVERRLRTQHDENHPVNGDH